MSISQISNSSGSEEYNSLLNSSHGGGEIPQIVTVSAINDLQNKLRQRDDRIAFLEKELVQTRLQLASAKTLEDQLFLELNKMSLELANATNNSTSRPRDKTSLEATATNNSTSQPLVKPEANADIPLKVGAKAKLLAKSPDESVSVQSSEDLCEPCEVTPNEGDTMLLPLGKPIISHFPTKLSLPSRERTPKVDASLHCLNPGSCSSGLDLLNGFNPSGSAMKLSFNSSSSINRDMLGPAAPDHTLRRPNKLSYSTRKRNPKMDSSWNNLNPGSCSSGLDLLNDFTQSGSAMKLSLKSINRNLLGLATSDYSLHKRKSGDLAADHRNMSVGNYAKNEGWSDAFPTSTSTRPQGNMFANYMLSHNSMKRLRSGDVAAGGHGRGDEPARNSKGNDGWDDDNPLSNPARTQGNMFLDGMLDSRTLSSHEERGGHEE